MRTQIHFFVLMVIAAVAAPSLRAQERIYCDRDVMANATRGGGTVQVNGFTVEVKPVPDPDVAGYMVCEGSVHSPEGATVFEKRDGGMEIDPITGRDVNGDGISDVVFVGKSGGAHCCWTYYVVSLGEHAGVVAEFANRAPATFEDLNRDGRVEVLVRDGTFDEGFGLSHPFSPFPLLILRVKRDKFADVGSEFWTAYEKEIQKDRDKLDDKKLAEFLASNPTEVHDDDEYLDTEYRVLAITLDYLYAGRPTEARAVLAKWWPAQYRKKTWEQIRKGYCSGLRARLKIEANRTCNSTASH